MLKKLIPLIIISLFAVSKTQAQTCSAPGQNPETAFPVCGTAVFSQSSVPLCGNRSVASDCPGNIFTDKNPYWYKFTCFSSGTLGFLITPKNLGDDYDWQLFDITNSDPSDVYSDPSLFVACNWSGESGLTGASSAGTSLVRCEGYGVPLFSSMPDLIIGHTYLLLISHFTETQSGYSLEFGGGTANITDPSEPHLSNASGTCDGTNITVKLNKKMKCNSLAPDGSDFFINTTLGSITSASGTGCSNGFDMDSISLVLSSPLPTGDYIITIKNGVDANTLKDNCDRTIPVDETIPLTVFPIAPTPMDSLTKTGCAPQMLELVFKKPIHCSSIAADGSDFIVTGTNPIVVTGATGDCSNGLTSKIFVQLSTAMQLAGNYQITLARGTDNNTIIDECSQASVAGAAINFSTKDTVSAYFNYNILYGCKHDTINYFHDGRNGVNNWQWNFDNPHAVTQQNPQMIYSSFGTKQAQLIVSNGVCSDTAYTSVFLDNTLTAKFEGAPIACPGDKVFFKDTSIGNITNWYWNFGNGNTSILKDPPEQTYSPGSSTRLVPVQLVVQNNIGCRDTSTQNIEVINNCLIEVPNAFTPNRDGLNDYLYPLNAYKAKDLSFKVYNRYGQLMFYTNDWMKKWDGKFKGQNADGGAYVWVLTYTNTDTNKRVEQKGTTILIR